MLAWLDHVRESIVCIASICSPTQESPEIGRDAVDESFRLRPPQWLAPYGPLLLSVCPSWDVMRAYAIMHDMGKPRCAIVDDAGRRHFPNHAEASKKAWIELGGSEEIGELMGLDMAIHVLKPETVESFAKHPLMPALLLSALAEVHANAEMFGGRDSDNFKAKWKKVASRGKALCEARFGNARALWLKAQF